jgi:FkbM family methyltransferase
MSFRSIGKSLVARTGYRVINATRRWGIDPLDDVTRILGGTAGVSIVLDIGANRGQSAIRFAGLFPNARVLAFEPVSSTFQVLSRTVGKSRQVTPYQLAAGERDGVSPITLFGDSGKSSLGGVMGDTLHRDATSVEEVRVVSLDSFLDTERIARVDFLKIDTEGHDLAVLKGASRRLREQQIDLVLAEYHHLLNPGSESNSQLGSLDEIGRFLDACGYRFVTSYTDGVHCDEPLGTYNALFMRRTLQATFLP